MERPTDAFKETHNLVVAAEDTYVGGLVSNLQVAELIGFMAKNRKAAYCKVVEVIAETTAPQEGTSRSGGGRGRGRGRGGGHKSRVRVRSTSSRSEEAIKAERPLSPYTAYEGLKTPSSASATSGSKMLQIEEEEEAAISSPTSGPPLSPYTAYDQLKAPSSPSPIPSRYHDSLSNEKLHANEEEPTATSSPPQADHSSLIPHSWT